MMKPLDYGRSFLIGLADWNEVRFWAESRTRIIDEKAGTHEDYVQTGSCKTEDTFGPGNLFREDCRDFLPVFGPEHGVVFCRHVYLPGYKTCRPVSEMWEGQKYHLVEAGSVEELTSVGAVLAATKAFRPIVSQTEIWNDETGLRAVIECPVKTMNTHRERNMYQVDTGPVAFPDLTTRHERSVDGLLLAFVAFNEPERATFVLEVPTPVLSERTKGEELCKVHHYSERLVLPVKNRLYAVD